MIVATVTMHREDVMLSRRWLRLLIARGRCARSRARVAGLGTWTDTHASSPSTRAGALVAELHVR